MLCFDGTPGPVVGCNNTLRIQMQLLGAEVHTSVHPVSTLGVFGFQGHVLISVLDTSFVWISGFVFKPIKDSFGLLNQIGFLVMFGEALPKTTGLCVNLSSYNRKVLCLHKEDVFIRFDIVAGSDVPSTIGRIEVLLEVT